MNRFDMYRRTFATADDGLVCWWYSGLSYVVLPDQPEIPLLQVAAIMTYRTQTLSPDAFCVHWSEIGVFLDPVTGGPLRSWTNPVTGATVEPPHSFAEGPGKYTVSRTDDGVRLELEQPHARIMELAVAFDDDGSRFAFTQSERKVRGYPGPDGTLPPADSPLSFEGRTKLRFAADKDALLPNSDCKPLVQGTYRFTLAGIPPWTGFQAVPGGVTRTLGSITRARPGERVNGAAWAMLQQRFPLEIEDPPAASGP